MIDPKNIKVQVYIAREIIEVRNNKTILKPLHGIQLFVGEYTKVLQLSKTHEYTNMNVSEYFELFVHEDRSQGFIAVYTRVPKPTENYIYNILDDLNMDTIVEHFMTLEEVSTNVIHRGF